MVLANDLDKTFETPPPAARPWCYWWWLNGAASKEGITRDFEYALPKEQRRTVTNVRTYDTL